MTNAIEQTKYAMYYELNRFAGPKMYDAFQSALEAHLEELRKGMVACNESTVKCAQYSAEAFVELERLNDNQCETIRILQSRLEAMTEERDSLRNKLQALQMASSTAAEVIRGLRSELEEAREGVSKPAANDIYMMGFNSLGKTSCPYPTNTIERLHWMDGDRERRDLLARIAKNCEVPK